MKRFKALFILGFIALTSLVYAGNPAIFSGNDVLTLKPSIDLFRSSKLISGAVDPSLTAVNAPRGSAYFSTSTAKLYIKQDSGSSTNWIDTLLPTSGWTITGNAGTNPLINFLGTTDSTDFNIKTNSQPRITVSATGAISTNLGLGILHSGLAGAVTSTAVDLNSVDVKNILQKPNGGTGTNVLGDSKFLYVSAGYSGVGSSDGSIIRPFLTIMGAINQIIANNDGANYTVIVGPGTYTETISLNNAALTRIAIVAASNADGGQSNDAIPITSLIGDINSTSNNDNLKAIIIRGLDQSGNIILTGASNGTNFCQYGCLFSDMVIYSQAAPAIGLTNASQVIFNNVGTAIAAGAGGVNIQNINFAGFYSTFLNLGSISLVTNNGANKPSGFGGTSVQTSFGNRLGATTVDAGSTLTQRFERVSGTLTSSGTLSSVQSAYLSAITLNAGTMTSLGDIFSSYPTQSGGTFSPSGVLYYNPSVPGNWSPVPTTINGALDELAANTAGGPFLKLSGGTMLGGITMSANGIFNLKDPVNPQDAATKFYVDNKAITISAGTGITITGATNTISLIVPVTTTVGGTGQTSYTNGQLLIGDGSSGSLVKSTLTAGTNITITNGPGSIKIDSTGGSSTTYSWSGYHANDCNNWVYQSASFTDPTSTDTSCTFVEVVNNNFGTVTSYNDGTVNHNYPGISFTAPATGTYQVCVMLVYNSLGADAAQNSFQVSDTAGTPVVISEMEGVGYSGPTKNTTMSACGEYQMVATTATTIRIRGNSPSTANINLKANVARGVVIWDIHKL